MTDVIKEMTLAIVPLSGNPKAVTQLTLKLRYYDFQKRHWVSGNRRKS